jgi:predicted CxxxxCH...CXXCH cytochrome family protein
VVPGSVDQPGHYDHALPAIVDFTQGLGVSDAAAPTLDPAPGSVTYDPGSPLTCRNVYCHGATLLGGNGGGKQVNPVWNAAALTAPTCDTCHGFPPPAPHPDSTRCAVCHPDTVDAAGKIRFTVQADGTQTTTHVNGTLDVRTDVACNACHGNASGDATKPADQAPPLDVAGDSSTTAVGVGAHQIHLSGSSLSAPVACSECHTVPAAAGDPGHIVAGPAPVTFGTLATTDASTPVWSDATATCTGTYCHGATLSGGTDTTPIWTKVDGTQAKCGACHSLPPPSPHPQVAQCFQCHGDTVDAQGNITNPAKHVDGKVEVTGGTACNACHGSATSNAPPVDTHGSSDTTKITVGAHQSHLKASVFSGPVACNECHVVPSAVDDPGHITASGIATVTFAGRSVTSGAAPVWNGAAATCSDVYCHGATLKAGGTDPVPNWTRAGLGDVVCGSCHSLPPPVPHPQDSQCSNCHDSVGTDGTIVKPEEHIDGKVEVTFPSSCSACHGSAANPAPPLDTNGRSATTEVTVGAHQAHLNSTLSNPVACTACHVVPATAADAGHIGPPPAPVIFSGLALTGGVQPVWDETTAHCTNPYCHGATLSGGVLTSPQWTLVDGSQVVCGNCHGLPPTTIHSAQGDRQHPPAGLAVVDGKVACERCHSETVGPDGTIAHPDKHIDGVVEVGGTGACNACHGSQDNNAPPQDTFGNTDTSVVTVGAHQAHLRGSNWAKAVSCDQCHVVPAGILDPGHLDSPDKIITFGSQATENGAQPAWNLAAAQCTNVYCHGATIGDGTNPSPVFTGGDAQVVCGSCHGLPPAASTGHPNVGASACGKCHSDAAPTGVAISDPTRHVDGNVDVAFTCHSCHGSAASNAPPPDTQGRSDTTLVSVGAHQSHLNATLSNPVACAECHVVPGLVGAPGHIDGIAEVVFGTLSSTGPVTPAWDPTAAKCSTVYCHGATLSGGTNSAPQWTVVDGSQAACGTCHGLPPTGAHPVTSAPCGRCHEDAATTAPPAITVPAQHIDGTVQVTESCNTCHGNLAGNPATPADQAPPQDLQGGTSTTLVTVGAHQSHLTASLGLSNPVACGECHTVPTSTTDPTHIDGIVEVTFGTLATTGAVVPSWTVGTAQCATVYCHGATLSGGTDTAPRWTVVDGSQAACGTCHGLPPTSNHPPTTAPCGRCHEDAATTTPPAITVPAQHIDGTVQASVVCNACHGNASGVATNPPDQAPPVDTQGGSATTLLTVGAHQTHLRASAGISAPIACGECHTVPTSLNAPTHIDGIVEVTFGTLATTGGLGPSLNTGTATCSKVYCHGASLQGGTVPSPQWTKVDNTQDACGACHGLPPTGSFFPAGAFSSFNHFQADSGHPNFPCSTCHPDAGGVLGSPTIAVPAQHVDGQPTLATGVANCSKCHD